MAIVRIGSIRPRDLRVPLFLVTVGVLCLFWIRAWAGVPTDQLRGSVDRVIQILEDSQLKAETKVAARRAAIRKEAESIFDFTET
ncbi:MAG TPA: hypothetical protein VNQ15_08490, partial [Verrucomicrobiae bacterium]|nr:hypothetical protein [Verrucomicrobiae bacterium]